MRESEIIVKCRTIFENLGWDVRTEEIFEIGPCNSFRYDMVLRHNGEVYGFVEVFSGDDLVAKSKDIKDKLEDAINKLNPRIFIITNGYSYDVYHGDKFYGTLSMPPAPEIVDIVIGGAVNG